MLKESANELECSKAHGFRGSTLGVVVAKAHIAVFDLDDPGVRDCCTEDVG